MLSINVSFVSIYDIISRFTTLIYIIRKSHLPFHVEKRLVFLGKIDNDPTDHH